MDENPYQSPGYAANDRTPARRVSGNRLFLAWIAGTAGLGAILTAAGGFFDPLRIQIFAWEPTPLVGGIVMGALFGGMLWSAAWLALVCWRWFTE